MDFRFAIGALGQCENSKLNQRNILPSMWRRSLVADRRCRIPAAIVVAGLQKTIFIG